jgi:hypothetical protein
MRQSWRKSWGMILALTLMFIPLALILAITVAHAVAFGSGYSLRSQQKAKSFYLAESGANVAYRLFQADNFSTDTHEPDGTSRVAGDPQLLADRGDLFNLTRDSDGWYVWEWNPGDSEDNSFTKSGRREEYRFQVQRPTPDTFRIECQASVGRLNETHILEGEVSSMLDYVVFDNGDLADFTGAYDEYVSGTIHANGDIFIRPFQTEGLFGAFKEAKNPEITLTVNSLTAGGQIIRHKDPWGNPDDGGTVRVTNATTGATAFMEGVSQGGAYAGPGNAYDALHPDWDGADTNANSAISRWDGAVADRAMGAQTKAAPLTETFEPGGYYSSNASLAIDSSTTGPWVSDVIFYNESEERLVQVKEIDLAALHAAGDWPSNGLLYSEEPLRLVNGHELPADITITSTGTVYVKGDFNKKFPTEASLDGGTPSHKKAAIMTPDRIYKLTSSFQDTTASDPLSLFDRLLGNGEASDPPLYHGDENNALEMNGAFVDGVPTTDARTWIDSSDNPYFVEDNRVLFFNRKVKQVSFNGGVLKVAYAQSDSLLETLQNVRLVGSGAIGHMKNARMADYDNSNASETVTPWLAHTYYVPPQKNINDKPGKEFEYDPELGAAGGLGGVPFAPKVGRRVRWYRR